MDIHHRKATIQRGQSNLQRDTGDVKKLKSRPPHLQHQRQTKRPSRKKEDELDYDIDQPAAPPLNPFRVFPVANIQPVIGILARRERWLLALLADMFIEPPGLLQTVQARAGGWFPFSGRKGTDRWRTGDGTSKTTPARQK